MVCPVDGMKSARAGSLERMEGTRLYLHRSLVKIDTWRTSSRSIAAISGSKFPCSGKTEGCGGVFSLEVSSGQKLCSGTTKVGGEQSLRRSLCRAIIEFLVSFNQEDFEDIAFSNR